MDAKALSNMLFFIINVVDDSTTYESTKFDLMKQYAAWPWLNGQSAFLAIDILYSGLKLERSKYPFITTH